MSHRYPLFFLYLAIAINMVGFSMVFPLLPFYAQSFQATPLIIGLLAASHALANFLTSPFLGRISDRFGRRPVLIIGLVASVFSMMFMGLANSLTTLFLARVIQGIVSSAILPTTRAYMGDVTTGNQRIAAMGKLGAAMSAGLLIGPAFSSFLVGLGNIHTPFFGAAGILFINALCVIFFLPESVKEKTQKLVVKEGFLNIFGIFKHLKGEFGILFTILFVWSFSMSNNQVAFPLLENEKFALGPEGIGYFFTGLAIVSIFVQGYFLPKVVKMFGEKRTLFLGLLAMGVSMILIPIAPTILLSIVSFLFMGLGSNLNRPVAEGIISRETEIGQGTTMGIAQSFESLGRVFGPALAGVLYSTSVAAPFLLSAIMLFFLAILSLYFLKLREVKVVDI